MKKQALFVVFVLVLATYATLALSVQAEDWPPHNPYVWIVDEDDYMRDEFLPGECLRILAYDSCTPYTITLVDPKNDTRKEWTSDELEFDSGLLCDVTDMMGCWMVTTEDGCCKFAVGMYNVVPEVAFGVLGALGACFAGFGIKAVRTKKNV